MDNRITIETPGMCCQVSSLGDALVLAAEMEQAGRSCTIRVGSRIVMHEWDENGEWVILNPAELPLNVLERARGPEQ